MASRGAAFEAMTRHSADRQSTAGLWLVQTGPRFVGRRTGPNGQAEGRVIAAGALDFIGDLEGRAVMFDCKSSEVAHRFDLDLVKHHQAVIIKNAAARGSCAFLLVELGAGSDAPTYFAVPWSLLEGYWEGHMRNRFFPQPKYPASIPASVLELGAVAVRRVRSSLDLIGAIKALATHVPPADACLPVTFGPREVS